MTDPADHNSVPHPLLADSHWLTAPETRRVIDALERAGIAVRAVGGTVRNTLLGEPVNDIDLAVDAAPERVIAAARADRLKVVPTGITHGTVTIVVSGTPFEVTTLRRDVSTDGRRATVAYTTDWKADAERRDFTINAIYCDRRGVLFDPVCGLPDIAARRVRFIGDPHERIREDYLRILRFFRFSAQYAAGELDKAGLAACIEERAGLAQLSAERIHHELFRLLVAPAAAAVARRMREFGFFNDLIGRPGDVDALDHMIQIGADRPASPAGAETDQQPDPLLRFAALAVTGPDDVAHHRARLRLSNAQAARLEAMSLIAPAISPATSAAQLHALSYRHGKSALTDALALASARDPVTANAAAYARLAATTAAWDPPRLPFSGRDVIARGIPAGPAVSAVLEAFEAWWITEQFPADRARLERKLAALVEVTKR